MKEAAALQQFCASIKTPQDALKCQQMSYDFQKKWAIPTSLYGITPDQYAEMMKESLEL